MKKLFLMLACSSLCCSFLNAQESLVKDVEKQIETSSDYAAMRTKLAPAFADETSKNNAQTWFVAAKLELKEFDDLWKKKMLGQAVDLKVLGNSLISGYDYMVKALPLDSVPEIDKKTGEPKIDKKTGKAKMKTKYSGKIVSMMAENFNPLNIVASELYGDKQYDKAVQAWEYCATMPSMKSLKGRIPELADTVIGELRFFQGIALWQNDNPKEAIGAFEKARKSGYTKKEAYDYALNCAAQAKDEEKIAEIAREAMPVYGKQDGQYIRILINYFLVKEDFAKANEILDKAIADEPQNAEFVNLKGNLVEKQSSIEEAKPYFEEAVKLDPNSSKANFDLGRYYFNKAIKVRDEKTDLTGEDLAKLTDPLYQQALPYLEKAYELDKDNFEAKNALRSIYYQLGDEAKLNAIENQ